MADVEVYSESMAKKLFRQMVSAVRCVDCVVARAHRVFFTFAWAPFVCANFYTYLCKYVCHFRGSYVHQMGIVHRDLK